jgi:HEPN domain-containing protein
MSKEKDYINFERLMQKINKYSKVSAQNEEIAQKWFLISKNDIEIAKIIYNVKYYAGTIYHIEQAFEKLIKGFYIHTGRVNPEEIFGHDFIVKRLKKEVTQIDDIRDFMELSSSLTNKSFSFEGFEEKISSLQRTQEEIRKMSSEEIVGILNLISEIEGKIASKKSVDKIKSKVNSKKTFVFLKQVLLKLIPGFRIHDAIVREAIDDNKIKDYIQNIIIGMKLHYFCIVTLPHFNTPRYPAQKNEEFGFFNYDKNLGIVKSIESIFLFFDEIINSIKQTSKKEASQ